MKNFIRETDGTVRRCTSNIAKMNVFEYLYYFCGWRAFSPVNTPTKDDLIGVLQIICWILQFTPLGIIYALFCSNKAIKIEKQEMKRYEENQK